MSSQIVFVTSYPPRECGIATYSKDLIAALRSTFAGSFEPVVCALNSNHAVYEYGEEVKYVLHTSEPDEYLQLARKINQDPAVRAVFLQHEFGLFGGEYGKDLLLLLYNLTKPVIVTFHSVLPAPGPVLKETVRAINRAADRIIVMTRNAADILVSDYDLPENKIAVIPHGTHPVSYINRDELKKRYRLPAAGPVLATFGFLSRGKSIETALDALPAIIEEFPETLYLVIGETHPEIVKREGEAYRDFLKEKVTQLGITSHVHFVNEYVSTEELLQYLKLTDIYLFTSKDPNQAVSGTFAYALSCGCPVVSTPIPHAREVLTSEVGRMAEFEQPAAFASAVLDLLKHPQLLEQMRLNALQIMQPTAWNNVAIVHGRVFREVFACAACLRYALPAVSFEHLRRMTTSTGLVQFSVVHEPDVRSGYTLDDNARALIACLMDPATRKNKAILDLAETYLRFIAYCQQPDGRFMNYVDNEGTYHAQNRYVNLEDSNGRAVWALGHCIFYGNGIPKLNGLAGKIMERVSPHLEYLESPRAIAFAIKGLYYYGRVKEDGQIISLIRKLADKLLNGYRHHATADWMWFEPYLTYANPVLPEGLLYAYLVTGDERYLPVARCSFNFLLSHIFREGSIRVISNRGWMRKGGMPALYGEQPIDVAYTILALHLFYRVTGNPDYVTKIETAFSWFLGNNHLSQVVYNAATGGCFDGLEETHVNLNQGAESTVCYLMARLVMEQSLKSKADTTAVETRVRQVKLTRTV